MSISTGKCTGHSVRKGGFRSLCSDDGLNIIFPTFVGSMPMKSKIAINGRVHILGSRCRLLVERGAQHQFSMTIVTRRPEQQPPKSSKTATVLFGIVMRDMDQSTR
jgi:hypothetical protein